MKIWCRSTDETAIIGKRRKDRGAGFCRREKGGHEFHVRLQQMPCIRIGSTAFAGELSGKAGISVP